MFIAWGFSTYTVLVAWLGKDGTTARIMYTLEIYYYVSVNRMLCQILSSLVNLVGWLTRFVPKSKITMSRPVCRSSSEVDRDKW